MMKNRNRNMWHHRNFEFLEGMEKPRPACLHMCMHAQLRSRDLTESTLPTLSVAPAQPRRRKSVAMPPPPVRLPAAPVPHGLQKKGEKLDIHGLFSSFNAQYFSASLQGVFVEYSTRMTSCAGTCTFHGPAGGCRIALSAPLLLMRPAEDTVATLLHEMIHASLFLKFGVERDSDDGHGPRFLAEAERVGALAGVQITVYHSFAAEVESHQGHWWTCGKCGRVVKRAVNRPPAPTDGWWEGHVRACGGEFQKSHQPAPREKPPKHGVVSVGGGDSGGIGQKAGVVRVRRIDEMFQSKAGGGPSLVDTKPLALSSSVARPAAEGDFSCPACNQRPFRTEAAVSLHLDKCIGGVFSSQVQSVPVDPPGISSRKEEQRKPGPAAGRGVSPLGCDGAADSVIDLDAEDDDDVESYTSPDRKGGSRWSRWEDDTDLGGAVDYAVPEDVSVNPLDDGPEPFAQPKRSGGGDLKGKPPRVADPIIGQPPARVVSTGLNSPPSGAELWARVGTDALLDFALGIGGPCAPDAAVNELPVASGQAGGFLRSENTWRVLPLPPFPHVVSHEESLGALNARLNLWQHASSPHEPVFASTAARLGLTACELLEKLQRMSKVEGTATSFLLSHEAKALLLEGAKSRTPAASSKADTFRRGDASFSPAKRPRRAEKEVRAPGHPAARIDAPIVPLRDASSRMPSKGLLRNHDSLDKSSTLPKPTRGARAIGDFFSKDGVGKNASSVDGKPLRRDVSAVVPQEGKVGLGRHSTRRPGAEIPALPAQPSTKSDAGQTTPCPICAVAVPCAMIDAHLELCMGASQDQSVIDLEIEPGEAFSKDVKKVDVVSLHKPEEVIPAANCPSVEPVVSKDIVECPFCSAPMKRSDLTAHIGACMAGEGLADVFE